MTGLDYRRDIDGLRAVAVAIVVLSHAGIPGFSGGFVGVDVFFVISGYLICSIVMNELSGKRFSLLGFYERRARRILPALFTVIFACFAVGWFVFPPPQYLDLSRSAIATILFVSNFWFQRNTGTYFGSDAEYEPLLHTWSLGVEEQFYLVFPLVALLICRWNRAALLPIVAFGSLASLAVAGFFVREHPTATFYMSPTRAWELGAGVILALLGTRTRPSRAIAQVLGPIGIGLIAYATFFFDSATSFPGFAAVVPVAGACAIIVAGMQERIASARLLSLPPMVGLGLVSYSLYLWHWPALVVARNVAGSVEPGLIPTAIAIGSALLAAWLSWKFVEQPFRRRGGSASVSQRATWLSATAGLIGVTAIGTAIIARDGAWSRAPTMRDAHESAIAQSAIEMDCWQENIAQRKPCVVGTGRADIRPSWFVWGDSHAAAMLPGLHKWLDASSLAAKVAIRSGCVPGLGVDRIDVRGPHDCSGHNQRVLSTILANPDIETVVLAGRWPLWATGKRPAGEPGGEVRLGWRGQGAEDAERYPAMFQKSLDPVVDRLARSGRKVVVITGVPELGFDAPRVTLATRFTGGVMPEGPRIEEVRLRQAVANGILEDILARHGGDLLDFAGIACRQTCPVSHEGELLYRDADHLSEAGAEFFVPALLDTLETGPRAKSQPVP